MEQHFSSPLFGGEGKNDPPPPAAAAPCRHLSLRGGGGEAVLLRALGPPTFEIARNDADLTQGNF